MNNITEQEIRYRLLQLLSRKADLTQREMAVQMGISLGKLNYCLSKLVEKGLIKINRFKASENKLRHLYQLTSSGLEAKANLTVSFLTRKIAEYDEIKRQIQELTREAEAAGLDLGTEGEILDEIGRLF